MDTEHISPDSIRRQIDSTGGTAASLDADFESLIIDYPEDRDESERESDMLVEEIDALVEDARAQVQPPAEELNGALGYVTNARNAPSHSDAFQFWAPAEATTLGIGTFVRHSASDVNGQDTLTETFAIITATDALTLGLDDFATHAYEQDGRPRSLASSQPAAVVDL